MRLLDIVVPDSQKLVVLHGALLVAAVQHSVGGVFHVLPETLYGMKIPVYPVIVTVPPEDGCYCLHCLCYRPVHVLLEPRLGGLSLRL